MLTRVNRRAQAERSLSVGRISLRRRRAACNAIAAVSSASSTRKWPRMAPPVSSRCNPSA